jgi:hypothetical protein
MEKESPLVIADLPSINQVHPQENHRYLLTSRTNLKYTGAINVHSLSGRIGWYRSLGKQRLQKAAYSSWQAGQTSRHVLNCRWQDKRQKFVVHALTHAAYRLSQVWQQS